MKTKIEEVARALCIADGVNPDGVDIALRDGVSPDSRVTTIPLFAWQKYRDKASAAIAAASDATDHAIANDLYDAIVELNCTGGCRVDGKCICKPAFAAIKALGGITAKEATNAD